MNLFNSRITNVTKTAATKNLFPISSYFTGTRPRIQPLSPRPFFQFVCSRRAGLTLPSKSHYGYPLFSVVPIVDLDPPNIPTQSLQPMLSSKFEMENTQANVIHSVNTLENDNDLVESDMTKFYDNLLNALSEFVEFLFPSTTREIWNRFAFLVTQNLKSFLALTKGYIIGAIITKCMKESIIEFTKQFLFTTAKYWSIPLAVGTLLYTTTLVLRHLFTVYSEYPIIGDAIKFVLAVRKYFNQRTRHFIMSIFKFFRGLSAAKKQTRL